MNPIYQSLCDRKSVRIFEDKKIDRKIKDALFNAALQAPTAGNQILYSIIDITDEKLKAALAESCDHQTFITTAPMVCVFVADTRRWYDHYIEAGISPRKPGSGDILLAIEDTMIAAQNTVVAAHSFGLGSVYIGDIIENIEHVRELLNLDEFLIPISMLVYGYPTQQQLDRIKPKRFDKQYIVHENQYRRLSSNEQREMFKEHIGVNEIGFDEYIKRFYNRKYGSDFAKEMTRSSDLYIKPFLGTLDED